ncbi:AAA family ATPase, partial [Streptomyces sp. SID4985]|uniref:ATP-binding protein n=1 Tax=Streptomyces sp. SID4985 TaxID=2690292 RepID=UPI0019290751
MLGHVETRSVSPVFVGRADELDTLRDALARAAGGEPQALLLGGEAGVGKTRLTEEFGALAAARGAVVARGGCVEIGADGLPFAPFSGALRTLRAALPEPFADAASTQEGELARLLPELGESTVADRPDEQGTARLFELTARLLERAAAERTVVLILEDLHWADTATRHLLAYLFRTLRTGRVLLLATYRSDDIHRRHPLRPLLAELDRLRTVRRLELARLTREEVGRQIAGILAAEPDPRQVDAIFERSDGNAFFVEELAVAGCEGCGTGLTDSLRDLLLVRVEALPESAQRVVRIIAEGGSTVEHRLIAAVARLAEDDLIEALRAAVGAHILIPDPDGDGYRFRHSLVREAVADDLLPGERSRLNRRYAEALEADPGLVPADARVLRLAGYWYHAHDPARALPAVLDAAVVARRRHAYTEQLRLLERATVLWDTTPAETRAALRPIDCMDVYPAPAHASGEQTGPDAPLRYVDLLAEAVAAGNFGGERERALKICKRALRLLEDEPDPLRAAWFWVQRSRLVQALARGDGWRELATAQDLVRGLPPSEVHAEVLALVAGWSMLHRPGPDAFAAAERAVEYARMVGAREIELHARLTLGSLMIDAGGIDAGLAELRQVSADALAEGVTDVARRAYINLPSMLLTLGRHREAEPLLREGLDFARRSGPRDPQGWMWSNLAETLYALGRWDETTEAAGQALRVGTSARPQGGGALSLARLALARGHDTDAARHLSAAREYYGTQDPMPQQWLPVARIALGIAAVQGRFEDARTELRTALERGMPTGAHRDSWPLLRAAAAAEADVRTLPGAEPGRAAQLALLGETVRTMPTGIPLWRAYEEWTRAELLRAEDRATAADWSPVVCAFECLDRPYDLARVRYRLAEALLAEGGEDERDRAG